MQEHNYIPTVKLNVQSVWSIWNYMLTQYMHNAEIHVAGDDIFKVNMSKSRPKQLTEKSTFCQKYVLHAKLMITEHTIFENYRNLKNLWGIKYLVFSHAMTNRSTHLQSTNTTFLNSLPWLLNRTIKPPTISSTNIETLGKQPCVFY